MEPLLVLTDLDGTLIRSDLSVSPYTRSVVAQAAARGIPVVAASARRFEGMRDICVAAGASPWMVCSNGALVVHRDDQTVIHEALLGSEQQREAMAVLRQAAPGVEFVTVAERGDLFRVSHGYPSMAQQRDHYIDPAQMTVADDQTLTDRPVLKLIARLPALSPAELAAPLAGDRELVVTWSGTPMIEISAPGATKAVGMAAVADRLGIEPDRIVAYGDGANDLAMLRAAGLGVAIPGGDPVVVRAADEVAPADNESDGLARHLAGLLGLAVAAPPLQTLPPTAEMSL